MGDRIVLEINNRNYFGWNRINISRTMEAVAGAFTIDLVDGAQFGSENILAGMACRVYMEDDQQREIQLLDGYIDERKRLEDGGSTALSVAGRDKTSDLVDCSAIVTSNTWVETTLGQMARDLCKPYGIKVQDQTASLEKFKNFTVQSSESAFSVIERACRQIGALPLTTEKGELLLGYAADFSASKIADLVHGENLLTIEEMDQRKNRYSTYLVKGQNSGGGKGWKAQKTTKISATATDNGVERYRNLVLMSEGKTTATRVQKRANWEAQVRAGRSLVHTVRVQGWYQRPAGTPGIPTPWKVNTLVNLISNKWGLNLARMITGVNFTLDKDGGRYTDLTLKDPGTYKRNPGETVSL